LNPQGSKVGVNIVVVRDMYRHLSKEKGRRSQPDTILPASPLDNQLLDGALNHRVIMNAVKKLSGQLIKNCIFVHRFEGVIVSPIDKGYVCYYESYQKTPKLRPVRLFV
jgi:hypothetical protein